MKFKIIRTTYSNELQPCVEAFADGEIRKSFKDRHGKERIFIRQTWAVEIGSLEELVEFTKRYDQIVFDGEEIEIYDGYRE